MAVGNRKDASPGISAADKLPDYRLGNEAADAAGEQEGKGKFLAVSDFHDVLPKLAILVVDASYAVNAKEQQSKFYVLAMLGIIKEAACQIIGCFVFRFSCVAGHERVAVGGENLSRELFVESAAVCLRGLVYIVLHQLDEIHRDGNIRFDACGIIEGILRAKRAGDGFIVSVAKYSFSKATMFI